MGKNRIIIKDSVLSHGVNVRLELPVPDVYSDENAASAMGKCPSEKNEGIEKFVEEIWAPQYFRHARQILKNFEASRFPIKFVKDQKWLLTQLWTMEEKLRGGYNPVEDRIVEDIDTTLMELGDNVFGFAVGCKIFEVKSPDVVKRTILDAHSIIPADEYTLKYLMACSAGNIVKKLEEHDLSDIISELAAERFEQLMLQLAWSV